MSNLVFSTENNTHKLSVYYDKCSESPRNWGQNSVMMCFDKRSLYGDKHSYDDIEEWARDMLGVMVCDRIRVDELLEYAIDNGYMLRDKSAVFYYTGINMDKNAIGTRDDYTDVDIALILVNECFILEDMMNLLEPRFVIIPVYKYEHSGVALSTGPFSCKLDRGKIGIIYTELKADNFPGMNEDEIGTEEHRQNIADRMTGEVEAYNKWLNNEVYMFELEEKTVCSCCLNTKYDSIDSCGGFYELSDIKEHLPENFKELFDQLDI